MPPSPRPSGADRGRAARVPLGLLALCCLAASVAGQDETARKQTYANVTAARVERFTNAVRITLQADGTLEAWPGDEMWNYITVPASGWADRDMAPIDRVPIEIANGRSLISAFVDVADYPVSHISLSPTGSGNLGVGLRCEIVLYDKAGVVGMFNSSSWDNWDAEHWRTEHDTNICYEVRRSQDMRSLIITVLSDQYEDTARVARRQPLPEDPVRLRVGGAGDVVTVEAVNVPVTRLLEVLGARSGRSLAVSALERDRWVTMYLPPMPVERVVAAVCAAYELSWTPLPDGGFAIGEARASDAASYGAGRTELLRCNYLAPSTAINLLPRMVLPYVRVDVERSAVVVNGPPALIEKVRGDLAALDRPPPLIEIEGYMVTVADHATRDRLWGWSGATGTMGAAVGPGAAEVGEGGLLAEEADEAGVGDLLMVARPTPPGGWASTLRALAADQRVRLVARPRVRVVNGHTGELFVGDERFLVMAQSSYSWGGLQAVPLGVRLRVTPLVGDGDEITVDLNAGVSSAVTGGSDASQISSVARSMTGAARVRDGDTIVIGGLLTEESARHRQGLPLLSELPVLRDLLGARGRDGRQEDVCFLLTARIVRDPTARADDSAGAVHLEGEAPYHAASSHPADGPYVPHGALRHPRARGRLGQHQDG